MIVTLKFYSMYSVYWFNPIYGFKAVIGSFGVDSGKLTSSSQGHPETNNKNKPEHAERTHTEKTPNRNPFVVR